MPKLKRYLKADERPPIDGVKDPKAQKKIELTIKAIEGYHVQLYCNRAAPDDLPRLLKGDSEKTIPLFTDTLKNHCVRSDGHVLSATEYFSHYSAKSAFKHNTFY